MTLFDRPPQFPTRSWLDQFKLLMVIWKQSQKTQLLLQEIMVDECKQSFCLESSNSDPLDIFSHKMFGLRFNFQMIIKHAKIIN